jgi:hypothetical protein
MELLDYITLGSGLTKVDGYISISKELNSFKLNFFNNSNQEILSLGKGSVPLTSLYKLVQISLLFQTDTIFFLFDKTAYLYKEVNCTEPSPLVRVPCSKIYF